MSEVKTVEMTVSKEGIFELNTLDKQLAYAQNLMSKGLVSETYKNPSQLVIAIQTCISLGVEPIVGLKWSYVIGGKATFFGDFPLMMVQKSGFIDWIEEFFIDEKGERICFANKNIKSKAYGAVCISKRKNDEKPLEAFFTIDDATVAGLFKNPTWNKYTKDMMMFRARGRVLRGKYSDALHGLEISEFLIGTDAEQLTSQQMLDQDFPIPQEEKEIGDLYRMQHGSFRGQQLKDLKVEEIEDYREKLIKRTTPKKDWETELISVFTEYLSLLNPKINE